MMLRSRLSPRGVWLAVWLSVGVATLALAACTSGNDEQQEQPEQQSEQSAQSAQAQPQGEPQQSSTAQPEQSSESQQSVQTQSTTVDQPENGDQPTAADSMSRDDQDGQQTSDAEGSGGIDPYGGQQTSASSTDEAPLPPVRSWLVEGESLTPSVLGERDEYGWAAAIEDDVIAVSAPYHDELGLDTGAVFIFERIDGEWVETAYLLPPYPDPQGWFGRWLALDEGRLVIGAPYEDGRSLSGEWIEDAGVAYVYEKQGDVWMRTGTLLPGIPTAGASFGWSVAISGDRIAVAAWEDSIGGMEAGSVTTYRQHKGLWRPEETFFPNEPSQRQMFGRDIALQDNILVVGAPGDDTIGEDTGAVYVWHHYDDQWNFAGKLLASDATGLDRLGSQVSLNGGWLAAGAHQHGDPVWNGGAVYVWRLETLWEFHAKLQASDLQPGDWFGYSVDIQNERMLIGSPHRGHPETGTYRSGAAYAFELVGGDWIEVGVLGPVDPVTAGERAEFGWVTEIDGQTAVVGAWLADTIVGVDAGAAAVYELPSAESAE